MATYITVVDSRRSGHRSPRRTTPRSAAEAHFLLSFLLHPASFVSARFVLHHLGRWSGSTRRLHAVCFVARAGLFRWAALGEGEDWTKAVSRRLALKQLQTCSCSQRQQLDAGQSHDAMLLASTRRPPLSAGEIARLKSKSLFSFALFFLPHPSPLLSTLYTSPTTCLLLSLRDGELSTSEPHDWQPLPILDRS